MLTLGIVGAGYWGPNVLRAFNRLPNCRVKTVADLKPGRREFIKKNFPEIATVGGHADIIKDREIEAVVIVTPPHTHYQYAAEALRAGKHVFVEKPLATSSKDAAELIDIAAKSGCYLFAGHLYVYHPAIRAVKAVLDSGRCGEVYYVESARVNLRPPACRENVVWDLAPHDFSILFYLLGRPPTSVQAFGRDFAGKGMLDVALIKLAFGESVFGSVHVSWLSPNRTRLVTLYCAKGVIYYDEGEPEKKVKVFGEGVDTRIGASDEEASALSYGSGEAWAPPIESYEPLARECEHFVECIENGTAPLTDGRSAFEVVRAIEIAVESVRKGGKGLPYEETT